MTDRQRFPRSSCCVPFCRRTSTLFSWEWMCGEHWRLVDRRLKVLRTRLLRRIAIATVKAEAAKTVEQQRFGDGQRPYGIDDDPIWALVDAAAGARRRGRRVEATIWNRMKRQAIERAAGASA